MRCSYEYAGGGFGDLDGRDFVSLGFLITNFSNKRQHAALAQGFMQPPGPNPTLVCAWARQMQKVRLYL